MTTDKGTKPDNCESETQRRTYSRPVLNVFGQLSRTTQGSGGTDNDGGGVMTAIMTMSDRSAKENTVKVANHPAGFGLYLFNYRENFQADHGYGRRFGVMADEIEQLSPGAVSLRATGYKMVNYGKLDIKTVDVATAFLN